MVLARKAKEQALPSRHLWVARNQDLWLGVQILCLLCVSFWNDRGKVIPQRPGASLDWGCVIHCRRKSDLPAFRLSKICLGEQIFMMRHSLHPDPGLVQKLFEPFRICLCFQRKTESLYCIQCGLQSWEKQNSCKRGRWFALFCCKDEKYRKGC